MDVEMPQAYTQANPKARKQHVCYECRGAIVVGEKYIKHSGIWDHQPAAFKVCADCEALRNEINKGRHNEDCAPFGGLCEDVFDTAEPLIVGRFCGIVLRRTGKLPGWMLKRSNEILERLNNQQQTA